MPAPAPIRPALVIPVHNDAEGLARLLDQARSLECFDQIVVVDDGSDTPVVSRPGVTLLRHDTAQGGGVARNHGLTAVTRPHVLFFDADDLLTDAFPELLQALGGADPFDFCQFKYADSRVLAEGLWGQPDWDEVFWERAGAAVGHLRAARPGDLPHLAQTANYPWNKLYRTEFLRANDIRCAATQVHQDIPLHWLSYLSAPRVLTSDRICAWHKVDAAGGRLTNRSGPERLEVFDALAPVVHAALPKGLVWQAALARFTLGLVDWGVARIDPDLRDRMRQMERDWLSTHIVPILPNLDELEPDLAANVRDRAGGAA